MISSNVSLLGQIKAPPRPEASEAPPGPGPGTRGRHKGRSGDRHMSEVDAQPGARPSLLRDPVLALLVVQSPQEIQGSWVHQDFVDGVTPIVRGEDVPPKLVAVRRHQRHRSRERATLDRTPVVLVLVHAEPRLLVGPVEIHVCKVEEGRRHVYFLSHTVPDFQEQRRAACLPRSACDC